MGWGIASGIFLYWLLGVYVSCWAIRLRWPSLQISSEDVGYSMALFWIFWPFTFIAVLLKKHFN